MLERCQSLVQRIRRVQQPVRKFEETPELRAAKEALADLEEEFRRTGLPAGWAR